MPCSIRISGTITGPEFSLCVNELHTTFHRAKASFEETPPGTDGSLDNAVRATFTGTAFNHTTCGIEIGATITTVDLAIPPIAPSAFLHTKVTIDIDVFVGVPHNPC